MARRATATPTSARAADPESVWDAYAAVSPPPTAPPGALPPFLIEEAARALAEQGAAAAASPAPARAPDDPEQPARRQAAAEVKGAPFAAELDVCEMDERERPGGAWAARARELSRSALVFRSRRMCYVDRLLLVAVHLIDAVPTPLYGQVISCSYEGEGEYEVRLSLLPVPQRPEVQAWLESR